MSINNIEKDEFRNLLDILPSFFTISLLMNTKSFNEFREKIIMDEVEQLTLDDPKSKFYILLALGFMYKNKDATSIFYKFIKQTEPSISFTENSFSNGINMVINKLIGLNSNVNTQSGGAKMIEYISIIGQLISIFAINYYYLMVYHKDIETIKEFGKTVENLWDILKNGCPTEEESSLQRVLKFGTKDPRAIDAFFNIRKCLFNPYVQNVATEKYFELFTKQTEEQITSNLFQQIGNLEMFGYLPAPSSSRGDISNTNVEMPSNALVVLNNEEKAIVSYVNNNLDLTKGIDNFKKQLDILSKMSPEKLRKHFYSNTPTTIPTQSVFSSGETVPTPPPFFSDVVTVLSDGIQLFTPSSSISDSFYYALADIFKDARRKIEDAQKEGHRKTEDLFIIAGRIYRNIINGIGVLGFLSSLNTYALGLIILLYYKLKGKKPGQLAIEDNPDRTGRKAFREIERGGYKRRMRKITKGRKNRKSSRSNKKRSFSRRRKTLRK